jgi:hypothetical protein
MSATHDRTREHGALANPRADAHIASTPREGSTRQAATGVNLSAGYRGLTGWAHDKRRAEAAPLSWRLVGCRGGGWHVLGRTVGEEPEGHRAESELLVIKLGLMTRQLESMTAAYPTVTSDLGGML